MNRRSLGSGFASLITRRAILTGLTLVNELHRETILLCYLWAGNNFFRCLLSDQQAKISRLERVARHSLWQHLEENIMEAGFIPVTPSTFLDLMDQPECIRINRAEPDEKLIGYAADFVFDAQDQAEEATIRQVLSEKRAQPQATSKINNR